MDGTELDAMISRMALAICNVIRRNHALAPITDLNAVIDREYYLEQARAAYDAQAVRSRNVYVIHKTSRVPGNASYSGPTWDRAGIRTRYAEQYANKQEAEELAALLTKHNPVGFVVAVVN